MGQSISFPHKLQQPGRKTKGIRFHDHDHQSRSFLRHSSMGGRLQSYGVILYQAPSPTTSTEVQGPTSSENLAATVPSPVMNDMISVGGKRTKQRWPIKVKTSSTITTMTTERSFAAVTPTRPTRTPRRLGPPSTPVAAVQPSPLPAVKSASSFSNAIASVASNSRVANDRIGLSLTDSAFNNSPSSALVSSGGSGLRTATPVRPRLPNLRLGELEQIFTAIVTSDDSSARVKLALNEPNREKQSESSRESAMASEEDWEDGEILEEGEEVEDIPPPQLQSQPQQKQDEPMERAAPASVVAPKSAILSGPPPEHLRRHAGNDVASNAQAHTPQLPAASGLLPRPTPLPASYGGGILGSAPVQNDDRYPRKRLHSTMQEQHSSSSVHNEQQQYPQAQSRSNGPRPPPSHQQSYANGNAGPAIAPSGGSGGRRGHEYEVYEENLIVKYPRQVVQSNVLLNFAHWMAHSRTRMRLDVEDLQGLILQVVPGDTSKSGDCGTSGEDSKPARSSLSVSPFLMESLFPNKSLPTKVCIVLLGNVHPSVLQRYRATLPFFDACSSVPCVLSKSDEVKRVETPLPELLYKFPRPPVDTKNMPVDELFYGHELTFMMRHSFGYMDEVIILPSGTFVRKSQPLGGTWELDGDLLHLKWRQQIKVVPVAAAASIADAVDEEGEAFTLDVLVSEDESMHYFNTDPIVDKTYARKTPEHLGSNRRRGDGAAERSIRLSLVKAVVVDVPRHSDGSIILPGAQKQTLDGEQQLTENGGALDVTTKESKAVNDGEDASEQYDIEYYVLSEQELIQHDYPVAVEDEQKLLDIATNGCTRDRFVQTRPRPEEEDANSTGRKVMMYALDCEMCETDIGSELTRITVVDEQSKIVYDQLVKPQSTIINYLTEFSGITPEMLQDEKCILADVQKVLLEKFLFDDTILVGHSLTSDLRALRIVHLKIADSSILYPHQRGFPFRTSLKYLTKTYLKKDIQLQEQKGHDSAEDAISAMELVLLKLRHGPSFGIPATEFPVGAFDSFAHKMDESAKKMALLRLSCEHEHAAGKSAVVAAPEKQDKPWQLYSSGDLSSHARSPYVHAKKFQSKNSDDGTAKIPISKVDECLSWASLKQSVEESIKTSEDDICWLEIDGPSDHIVTSDFLFRHEEWMKKQQAHCEALSAFLQDLRENVLPEGMLLVTVPQGDLAMLRYLKGLRTRSKWRDAAPNAQWTDDMQAAVTDAFRGTMDSCVFLTQK